jgi:integrase
MTAYLQTLKETMADPTEALRLRWIDISGNIVSINAPVKGHRPRQLQVSNKLLAMLQVLPHTSERIFQTNYRSLACCYKQLRKRVAHNLQNPRLLKITFVTFRHWGATMLYHYSRGNILLVKKLLGHKNINSTMKYTQLIEFHDDDYDVATAATVEEAKSTIATGYEFVVEKNGIMLFRRPKRFGSYTT